MLRKEQPLRNAFTIDVEDYFQVSAMAPYVNRSEWNSRDCRVERNLDRILAMLAHSGTRATFFTLGWVAERYPGIVREIAKGGHEIASHGYGHQRASDLSETEFFSDISQSKAVLEDLTGQLVSGYRAPSFSIGSSNLWAFDCLERAGYRYSSSVFPIQHDHYGMPNAPRFAYWVRPGLKEIPITTFKALGRNFPASGGGYFRLLPYRLSAWMLNRVNVREKEAGVFYFHPWEIDVEQPRIAGIGLKTRFRHYVNIPKVEKRLQQLLQEFNWGRMDEIFLTPGEAIDARV